MPSALSRIVARVRAADRVGRRPAATGQPMMGTAAFWGKDR
jgi:hypothetical protein